MRSPVTCPYCSNVFGDSNDTKAKKKIYAAELDVDHEAVDIDDSAVLDGEDINNDLEVIKINDIE
jgi:hypothetical protein